MTSRLTIIPIQSSFLAATSLTSLTLNELVDKPGQITYNLTQQMPIIHVAKVLAAAIQSNTKPLKIAGIAQLVIVSHQLWERNPSKWFAL